MSVVERCPLGVRCESCGRERTTDVELAVREMSTGAGLLCLTLCPLCTRGVAAGALPIAIGTAERLVAQHRGHLEGAGVFVCPKCRACSHNPTDLREGYCGACHEWTGAPLVRP